MNEQQRILDMIEKGQITAAEGMELLNAIHDTKESEPQQNFEIPSTARRNFKFLKIKVSSDQKTLNVNVNIPIRLLTTIGEIADRLSTLIPADARQAMKDHGMDVSSIDFAQIIDDILDGTLDDPTIIDMDAWDETHKAMIKIKVYVD